ncbi:MAG: phenylacetate--CoA ligase family protein, partial [Acetobacteraceae bacterium]|nr:phenylacetate--CoA ligase family protein [Acetobacteraceae bacterium]
QPLERIRALQDRLLRGTIEICYRNHPYYGAVMRREKLEPRHIQSCADLVRLPLTSKTDFLGDPDAFRLRGDGLPLEMTTLWKVIYTTGTTSGAPAPVYVTTFDHYAYMYLCSRREGFVDIRPTDVIANLFPLTPFPMGAYSRAPDEAAAAGAGIVFAHTGRAGVSYPVHHSLDEAVRLVEQHRATILWGVASFVRRVIVRAQEVGADFRAVRMAMVTGEASSAALKEDLRRRLTELGCTGPLVVNRYGSTEQGASMVECEPGSGFHSLAPDQVFHEVVDEQTGARLPDGARGMIAFTHLMRRGTVFLRYLVGDVVTMTELPCPHCGRTSPRITSQPVRSGDIVKVKGTLVNLQALKDHFDKLDGLDEYQIVIRPSDPADPFSMDELVVRMAARAGREDAVREIIVAETTAAAHVRPVIELTRKDDIFDPLGPAKPRRVVDLRPAV